MFLINLPLSELWGWLTRQSHLNVSSDLLLMQPSTLMIFVMQKMADLIPLFPPAFLKWHLVRAELFRSLQTTFLHLLLQIFEVLNISPQTFGMWICNPICSNEAFQGYHRCHKILLLWYLLCKKLQAHYQQVSVDVLGDSHRMVLFLVERQHTHHTRLASHFALSLLHGSNLVFW